MIARSIADVLNRVAAKARVSAIPAGARALVAATVRRAVRTFAATVRATSRAVWVFLATEAALAVVLLTLAAIWAHGLAVSLDLRESPPWRALAVFAPLGAAVHTLRLAHAGRAARRWHGVLVRRIDQRWAAER